MNHIPYAKPEALRAEGAQVFIFVEILVLKFIKLTGGEPERGANNIWLQRESDIYRDVIRGLDNYWCSGCYTDVSL